jgi:hypothetical protein
MDSDRGRKYESRIEHHRRRARVFRQRMGSTGNQCFARKFYVRTNEVGGARRHGRDCGGRSVDLGQPKKTRRALTRAFSHSDGQFISQQRFAPVSDQLNWAFNFSRL